MTNEQAFCSLFFFCTGDGPKSGPARAPDGRLQSRDVPFGTSCDWLCMIKYKKTEVRKNYSIRGI